MASLIDLLKNLGNQLGKKYILGKSDPDVGFDCSGLVQWVYKSVGITIPLGGGYYLSEMQFNGLNASSAWERIYNPADLKPGDIIYTKTSSGGDPSHAGVYVGNGKVINAYDEAHGVITSALSDLGAWRGGYRYRMWDSSGGQPSSGGVNTGGSTTTTGGSTSSSGGSTTGSSTDSEFLKAFKAWANSKTNMSVTLWPNGPTFDMGAILDSPKLALAPFANALDGFVRFSTWLGDGTIWLRIFLVLSGLGIILLGLLLLGISFIPKEVGDAAAGAAAKGAAAA